jgi:ADP-ribose pyrophosphatase
MKQTLFETRWLGVYRIGHWDFVQRQNADAAVGILAITPEDEVVLVEQFRIPLQRRVIEVPAGLVGDEDAHRGESLAETARRELLEETGYTAGRMEPLVSSPTSAGMTSEYTHLFLARDLTKTAEGGGIENEDIEVHRVPLASLREWLRDAGTRGVAVDFKIHAALWAAGL